MLKKDEAYSSLPCLEYWAAQLGWLLDSQRNRQNFGKSPGGLATKFPSPSSFSSIRNEACLQTAWNPWELLAPFQQVSWMKGNDSVSSALQSQCQLWPGSGPTVLKGTIYLGFPPRLQSVSLMLQGASKRVCVLCFTAFQQISFWWPVCGNVPIYRWESLTKKKSSMQMKELAFFLPFE